MNDILPLSEIKFQFALSSGPGGQNVNKVNTKAILIWDLKTTDYFSLENKEKFIHFASRFINKEIEFTIMSQEHSTQKANKDECLRKLSQIIKKFYERPKKRKKTVVSRSIKAERAKNKKNRSEVKKLRSKVY